MSRKRLPKKSPSNLTQREQITIKAKEYVIALSETTSFDEEWVYVISQVMAAIFRVAIVWLITVFIFDSLRVFTILAATYSLNELSILALKSTHTAHLKYLLRRFLTHDA